MLWQSIPFERSPSELINLKRSTLFTWCTYTAYCTEYFSYVVHKRNSEYPNWWSSHRVWMISCFRLKSILSSILGSFFLLLASMSLISLAVMLRLRPLVGPSGEWDGLGLLRIELPRLPRTWKKGVYQPNLAFYGQWQQCLSRNKFVWPSYCPVRGWSWAAVEGIGWTF